MSRPIAPNDDTQHNERDVKKKGLCNSILGLRELSEISGIIPENPGRLAREPGRLAGLLSLYTFRKYGSTFYIGIAMVV